MNKNDEIVSHLLIDWRYFICNNCKNYDEFEGCLAFQDGEIPYEITSTNVHSKPLSSQNNNLVFDPIDLEEYELYLKSMNKPL